MAGEYEVARECIAQALARASLSSGMSSEGMADALMVTLIMQMLKGRSRKDLASFIDYQIESCGEDEFVVTRGC